MVQHGVQRPHPVSGDIDQPDAWLLEPIRDPLGFLNARGRPRIRWLCHGFGRGSYGSRNGLRHFPRCRERSSRKPPVTDDMYFPVELNLARSHDLSTCREATDPVKAGGGTGQCLQPPPDNGCFLEPLLINQPAQSRLNSEYGGACVDRQRGAYGFDDLPVAVPGNGAVAGRRAPADACKDAGGDRHRGTQSWRALSDREAVVDGESHILRRLAAGERAEIGRAGITNHPYHGQPRKWLVGDLDPLCAFREL